MATSEFEYMTRDTAIAEIREAHRQGIPSLLLDAEHREVEVIDEDDIGPIMRKARNLVNDSKKSGGSWIRVSDLPADDTYGLALAREILFVKAGSIYD